MQKGKTSHKSGVLCMTTNDGEAVVLVIWGVWRILSLSLLSGPLLSGMIVPVRVPSSIGQMDLFKIYSYLVGLSAQNLKKQLHRNVNMNA